MQRHLMRASNASKAQASLSINILNIANASSPVPYHRYLPETIYLITRHVPWEDPAVMASVKVRNQLNPSAFPHISKAPLETSPLLDIGA